ncbi:hypothetical protein [Arthrobacter sp. GMC3]|nr:hypothetical protein [Arthrobacter sp. GMC3]
MSARVSSPAPRRFNAWCDNCAEGVNTNSKLKADKWAYSHNLENHLRKAS